MPLRNDDRRYGALAQGLHWLIAALIIALFGIGWVMEDMPLGPDKIRIYNIHKSIGVTVLALMVIRLAWRWISPPPPLPAHMPAWEQTAAKATHVLIYLLVFAQPIIGILHSNAANFPVVVFNTLILPSVIAPDEELKKLLVGAHHWLANVIAVLILLHIGAALRHHFMIKDDILRRMLPGAGR